MASLALSQAGWLPGQLGRWNPIASHCLLWPDAEKCTFSVHVLVCHSSPEPPYGNSVWDREWHWDIQLCSYLLHKNEHFFICLLFFKSQDLGKTICPVPKVLGYTNTETLASVLKVTGISCTSLLPLQLLILSILPFNSECVWRILFLQTASPQQLRGYSCLHKSSWISSACLQG